MRPECRKEADHDRYDHPQPLPRGDYPRVSLPELVFADAGRASKPALIDGSSGRNVPYDRATATRDKSGEWPPPEQADLPTFNTVSARITALRARVLDDVLRLLVRELQTGIWSAVEASDWSAQEERMVAARDPMNRMQERVHLLLNQLF